MTRQGIMIKEVKDSMLKSHELRLNEEKARANRELAARESALKQLTINIRDEVNEESRRNLEPLLEELQEQKASNEVFRKTCEEVSFKTKIVYDEIQQEIKSTKADNNSRAVAGLINTSGEVRNIKQNISDTSAGGGSFAGAGIIQGVDLSIPSSSNE